MKTLCSTACALAAAVWLGSAGRAQEPATPRTTQAQPPSQSGLQALDGQTVTVTGCVRREAHVSGQQPSPPERVPIVQDYVLTDVQVKSASPRGETAGRDTPPRSEAAAGTRVKLVGVEDDELNKHVDRLVEITGRLDATPGPGTTPTRERPTTGTGGTESTGRTPPSPRSADLPELEVESVRVLSQSCTPQV